MALRQNPSETIAAPSVVIAANVSRRTSYLNRGVGSPSSLAAMGSSSTATLRCVIFAHSDGSGLTGGLQNHTAKSRCATTARPPRFARDGSHATAAWRRLQSAGFRAGKTEASAGRIAAAHLLLSSAVPPLSMHVAPRLTARRAEPNRNLSCFSRAKHRLDVHNGRAVDRFHRTNSQAASGNLANRHLM